MNIKNIILVLPFLFFLCLFFAFGQIHPYLSTTVFYVYLFLIIPIQLILYFISRKLNLDKLSIGEVYSRFPIAKKLSVFLQFSAICVLLYFLALISEPQIEFVKNIFVALKDLSLKIIISKYPSTTQPHTRTGTTAHFLKKRLPKPHICEIVCSNSRSIKSQFIYVLGSKYFNPNHTPDTNLRLS